MGPGEVGVELLVKEVATVSLSKAAVHVLGVSVSVSEVV